MADHTISIANTLRMGGGGPPTLWGSSGATTMTWGTDKWLGESEDYIQAVGKLVTDTLAFAGVYTEIQVIKIVANALAITSDMTVEYLTNGIWYYVFPDNVTNAESRITTTWASTSQTSTYATPSTPATTWS